jgi:hypothetical protein
MTRPAGRLGLSLTLSLVLHALLGLAIVVLSSPAAARVGGPIAVDALVLDEAYGGIILDAPPAVRKGAGPSPAAAAEESEEPFTSTVGELPVVSPNAATGPEPVSTSTAGSSGGSRAGTAGLLRPPATARNIVYLIDSSLSMGLSGALPVAKRELLAALDVLPTEAHFAVILYNRQAEPLSPDGRAGLLTATEANRTAVAHVVREARAEGGTDHLAALHRAVSLGADVIFLVTDADELTMDQVRKVAQLNRSRAVIHAVEINCDRDGPNETPLKLLARLTGGSHRIVPVKR